MDGDDVELVDVVHDEINSLRTTVTNIVQTVGRLETEVSGLMATSDRGVYGEAYAEDQGPAVRAKFFVQVARSNEDNGRRTRELTEHVSELEATMALMSSTITDYTSEIDQMVAHNAKLEGELMDLSG